VSIASVTRPTKPCLMLEEERRESWTVEPEPPCRA
jgi:hypothetical protein